jgi:hypothetical protein
MIAANMQTTHKPNINTTQLQGTFLSARRLFQGKSKLTQGMLTADLDVERIRKQSQLQNQSPLQIATIVNMRGQYNTATATTS